MASFKPVSLAHKIFEASHDVKEDNPIIFLHGLGAAKEHWADIPQKVADRTHRRVYAIDARNHGDSAWNDEFNFSANMVDIIHFIENIKAEKVVLVGHSMGGVTSMKTALKMPSKVDRIVIEDMGIVIPKEIVESIKMLISLYYEAVTNIPAGSSEEEMVKFLGEFFYNHLPEEAKTFIRPGNSNKFKDYLKQNPDGTFTFRANFKVLMDFLENHEGVSEFEGVYDGPACFIYGKQSIFPVKQHEEDIKKYFPNGQFVGIEDATHDVHSDAPDTYIEVLLKFLKE